MNPLLETRPLSSSIQRPVADQTLNRPQSCSARLARRQRRHPAALANWLMRDVQALDVRGETRIPSSFQKPVAELVSLLTTLPEEAEHRIALQHPSSISDLMQVLVATEASLSR